MINFIENKDQVEFPFKSQDTLKNPTFMRSFYREMLSKSSTEIQQLVEQVRKKNQALRAEINELRNKKATLLNTLDEELELNKKLTNFNDNKEDMLINKMEKANVDEAQKESDNKITQEENETNQYKRKMR